MFQFWLAHGSEFHEESTTNVEHAITEPVGFGLIAIAALGLLIIASRSFHWQFGTTIMAVLALLLTGGIFGYRYMPAIGAIMIAVGITLALSFVLLSLVNERNHQS